MKLILSFLCLAASMAAAARPLDAEGTCPTKNPIGAINRIAKGPFAGKAADMKQASAPFAAAHAAATAGEYPWLHDLSGKAGANRSYRERGNEVIVATVCEPTSCDRLRAYVAFDPASGAWGATVFEGARVREIVQGAANTTLAMHKQSLANALLCAANTDSGVK